MASENSQQRVSWPVAFGEVPRKGSRAMAQTLDFTIENPINISLTYEEQSARIEFVQGMFVDNSLNPSQLIITMKTTNQIIRVPAGYQAYVPVLASSDHTRFQFQTNFSTGNAPVVNIHYLSFPVALDLWPANIGGTGKDFGANKPSVAGLVLLSTAPVNGARANIEVQNQSGDPITIQLDDGNGGNISYILLAAGSAANTQGGAWSSTTFKGRVRVYGQSGDQVGMHED